ncbi:MAG TPA: PQQ-dependent sugar dehydrogenase [Gammaproteobacteria bacterium]
MSLRYSALSAVFLSVAAVMLIPSVVAAQDAGPDWQRDAPGRVHRIDLSSLPEPFATGSNVNFPRIVPRPDDAELTVPQGFTVDVYTRDVERPRVMRVAPNGDVFVAETRPGRIRVLRPSADGATAKSVAIFAEGLTQPFGMQFYPAENPEWLYVAENNRVVRYRYRAGDTTASGEPEVLVPELAPTGRGHYTRDLVFSPDGRRMFVSVGSESNVAEDMPESPPGGIEAWEAEHGVGAAWGNETRRADVLVFDVAADGKVVAPEGKIYATGIRNCVALGMNPDNGDVWCTVNERDGLGDEIVPDYSTRVQEGGFYGWPWYYMGNHEDPRHAGERPDLAGKALTPDVPYRAHSAAVGFLFYGPSSGAAAFPEEYVGDAFAVFHGSWNRADRTGHKVVRLPLENGVPTGEYVDFLVGFITDAGEPWGRPSSLVQLGDGSLLLSDDEASVIYRIAYSRSGGSR